MTTRPGLIDVSRRTSDATDAAVGGLVPHGTAVDSGNGVGDGLALTLGLGEAVGRGVKPGGYIGVREVAAALGGGGTGAPRC